MNEGEVIPSDYESWRDCITVRCGIALNVSFIDARLKALRDGTNPHTRQFHQLYGEAHLERVIDWYERAKQEH